MITFSITGATGVYGVASGVLSSPRRDMTSVVAALPPFGVSCRHRCHSASVKSSQRERRVYGY